MKKVILITGASKGMGENLAIHLSQYYNLILCSRNIKLDDSSKNFISLPCDITKKEDIENVITRGIEKFGKIDILINNAGWWQFTNFENITEEELLKMYEVNVKGILLCTQAVLPIMRKLNNGHIINILSIRAISGGPKKAAYSASKFAAKGLMDSLRIEVEPNIRITNICPGKVSEEDVTYSDLCKTVDYILSLSDKAIIRDLIIGGQL